MFKNLIIRNFSVNGFGRVLTGPKNEKLVKNLKEGDSVLTPYGKATITKIKVKVVENQYNEMVELNKMLITPNHPIEIFGQEFLPRHTNNIKFHKCNELFDFELDKYHILTINGINVKF